MILESEGADVKVKTSRRVLECVDCNIVGENKFEGENRYGKMVKHLGKHIICGEDVPWFFIEELIEEAKIWGGVDE